MNARRTFKWLAGILGIGLACSISLADVSWVLAGLVILALKIARPKAWPWRKTGFEWPLLALGLWSLIRLPWGSPWHELLTDYKTDLLLPIFLVVTQAFDEDCNRRLMKGFLIASFACAALGCLQWLGGLNWDPTSGHRDIPASLSILAVLPQKPFRYISLRDGRAMGTRSHPLTYAECLLPAFFFFLCLALHDSQARGRWKHLMGAALVGLAIFFSQSRGVWVGLAVGLVILLWQHRSRRAVLAATTAVVLGAVLLWLSPESRGRFVSIFQPTQGLNESSKDARYALWAASLETIRDHPLSGVGTGFLRLMLPERKRASNAPSLWTEAHNIYLQQTAEGGLIGLILFLWLLFKLGKTFWFLDNAQDAGFFAMFVGLLVCGLTESWFNDAEPTLVLLALGGSAWLSQVDRRST